MPAGGASPREGGGGGGAASKPATSLAKAFTAFKTAFKRQNRGPPPPPPPGNREVLVAARVERRRGGGVHRQIEPLEPQSGGARDQVKRRAQCLVPCLCR